jgi:hypothetical protein
MGRFLKKNKKREQIGAENTKHDEDNFSCCGRHYSHELIETIEQP